MQKLSRETPARYVVFDLLVDNAGRTVYEEPLSNRRVKLEAFAKKYLAKNQSIELSPTTRDLSIARKWLATPAAKLDGIKKQARLWQRS